MSEAVRTSGGYDIAAAEGYAGDVKPGVAWRMLGEVAAARLVDVRTAAEWAFVGGPDLRPLGKNAIEIEWQSFPSMRADPEFARKAAALLGDDRGAPVLLLCRSGARSASAARALTAAGYAACFNVADGFEGPLDGDGRRGRTAGWKVEGLPWKQK
ncbi:MAG: rhodanese-like domain-containing protein [Rhodospirillales bacterium]|nr:rhodanese-like domain-containing protein [Rhodospirillales bacterium]QQS10565.1 MAG: rhodanese-like domain-containing protein [Rhodospirillales bacterium]